MKKNVRFNQAKLFEQIWFDISWVIDGWCHRNGKKGFCSLRSSRQPKATLFTFSFTYIVLLPVSVSSPFNNITLVWYKELSFGCFRDLSTRGPDLTIEISCKLLVLIYAYCFLFLQYSLFIKICLGFMTSYCWSDLLWDTLFAVWKKNLKLLKFPLGESPRLKTLWTRVIY